MLLQSGPMNHHQEPIKQLQEVYRQREQFSQPVIALYLCHSATKRLFDVRKRAAGGRHYFVVLMTWHALAVANFAMEAVLVSCYTWPASKAGSFQLVAKTCGSRMLWKLHAFSDRPVKIFQWCGRLD